MYAFGSLPGNLIAFGDFLRREYGFKLGSGELHDAARALEVVDLADELRVRDALRPILSRTLEDASVFDPAFTAFFFPGPAGVRQAAWRSLRRGFGPEDAQGKARLAHETRPSPGKTEEEEKPEADGGKITPLAITETAAAPGLLARASYSPLEAETAGEAPELRRVEPAWREAARVLVHRLHLGLSRRWRTAARGPRFDLRRTLRASLQTGGEAITARWLRRPRRTPRFVLLIDGSRSMEPYTQTALRIAVAMAGATMRLEVFTFSTALRRVTNQVRSSAAGETRRLEHLLHAWAGGTSIGPCLREFLRRFGERMIGRATVVMIVSDGLDVGEPSVLRDAMRELHRRSACLVWLNPLIETPGYEPTASGMSAARPYITTFASANDIAGFARLARLVRVRA
ncbi:MAG TPA: VWA domain-containing protein [Candidatus Dormibacteraeota bacterium]|nr:VWA domain-containing protein [Candidatus Dormibacteraeota bacterium]